MTSSKTGDTDPRAPERSWLRRGPLPWLILGGVGLIAVVAIATTVMIGNYRQQALKVEETNLENTVSLLARHFDQQFADLVAVQKDLIFQLQSEGVATPADFLKRMGSVEQHKTLSARLGNSADVSGVNIYDADGVLINSSKIWPVPAVSIADRDYFKLLKADGNSSPYRMDQTRSRLTGISTTIVAYRVSGPHQEFLGVIVRGLDSARLESFFSSISLPDDSAISMFVHGGTMIARFPHVESLIGTRLSTGPFFAKILSERDHYTSTLISPVDGKERLIAARMLQQFPVSISATATVNATLAPWREQTSFLVGVAALCVVIIVALVLLVIRQLSAFHRTAQNRIHLQKQHLDFAINNMSQGLLLFNSQDRLVLHNDRYIEMFNVAPDAVQPGCTLKDLVLHRQEAGAFEGDVDGYCTELFNRVKGKTSKSVLEVGQGQFIEFCHRPTADGGWVTTLDDITERRRAESRIAHMAHFDALTDLPNRALFRERLEDELKAIAGTDTRVAVLYIDVDEFKSINDSLGHFVGDALLKSIAERLAGCVSQDGFVARLGGDEFAIVCTNIQADDVRELAVALQSTIRAPYECLGHHLSTDASIGIAIAPQDGANLDELLKNADLAMYAAKAEGRRTYRFFEPAMEARIKERLQLETDLRHAISAGQLEVHYQPLVCLRTNAITGCEALLRWRHPTRGFVSPAEFIPIAEERGLITEIGEWVLKTACAEAATWPRGIKVAVNVSPVQFRSSTLCLHVISALAASGLDPHRLELEITEAVLISDDDIALEILHQLRSTGVQIALDDFGTGYSSLSYLQRFPFDKIKIDRCFVDNIDESESSSCIVRAVVSIAKARNMTTTAEGVETREQQELVRNLGCTEMQGFVFSGAKPAAEIMKLLMRSAGDTRVA
ncbi:EAL domain-containing protein [Bradyrhizobium sp. dw_78]|uniref:bifunctional diguanylate cyclase/phosphodiesterase n=1 Tax=Bradyrhizobium sp. dw_78 TaxID=2719793 RepID=UPI001BD574B5|nr:EAL domain-containing protein [Bradyrhizobium sp. dw_78]